MNKKSAGRPVDLSGIDIGVLKKWMVGTPLSRKAIICQLFISLSNGVSMSEACRVMGVTRESVRLWKEELKIKGFDELVKIKKKGKRTKLTGEQEVELKGMVNKSPKKQGYKGNKWTGRMVLDIVQKRWGHIITLRTAQLWLAAIN
jgi:transposase